MSTTKKTTAKKAVKKSPKSVAKKVTKKTVKKTAKKATKKVAKKTTKKVRALVCAADEECFWTSDGQVLADLNQLEIAFGSMADEVFLHHVTKEKNDFADWVEQVLNDIDCATALRRARQPKTARTAVVRFLKTYNY